MSATRHDSAALADAMALLSTPRTGRIVYTVRAMPAVLPVRLALDGPGVVVDCFVDPTLVRAVAGSVVALQTDELDVTGASGWSLTLTGHACDPAEAGERLPGARLPGSRRPVNGTGLLLVVPSLFELWRLPPSREHEAAAACPPLQRPRPEHRA